MAVIASGPGPNASPLGELPTPLLLAGVGGAIGLIVLLRRKAGAGSGTSTDHSTLLPNTAIMLGSLQQSVLDLSGQVGKGNADISSQLTGTQENISGQIDALTSQQQKALTDLQGNITGTINTGVGNLSDSLSKVLAGQDAISTLIGQSEKAQAAYNQTFSSYVQKGFDNLTAAHNAELAGLSQLGSNVSQLGSAVSAVQSNVSGLQSNVSGLQSNVSGLQSNVSGLSGQVAGLKTNPAYNMPSNSQLPSTLNDTIIFSRPDNNYYLADRGHLYGLDWWYMLKHFQNYTPVNTNASLSKQVDAYLGG